MAVNKTVPAHNLAPYEEAIAQIPTIERKGKTSPYTSVNGHMFSFLTIDGALALRLPKEAREAFLEKHATKLCQQYGVVMKEYVIVPDALVRETAQLAELLAESLAHVASLKPKPTKRAAKKG